MAGEGRARGGRGRVAQAAAPRSLSWLVSLVLASVEPRSHTAAAGASGEEEMRERRRRGKKKSCPVEETEPWRRRARLLACLWLSFHDPSMVREERKEKKIQKSNSKK